jgi:hypothetical protein
MKKELENLVKGIFLATAITVGSIGVNTKDIKIKYASAVALGGLVGGYLISHKIRGDY